MSATRNGRTKRIVLIACAGLLAACSSDSSSSSSSSAASASTATTAAAPTSTPAPASSSGEEPTTSGVAAGTSTPGSETATTVEATPTTAPPTVATEPATTVPPNRDQFVFTEVGKVSNAVDLTYRAGDDALYIVSQDGFVVAMRDGVVDDNHLLDITGDIASGGEQGLLGLTFSADGTHAYVDYTNANGNTEITEYAVGSDGVFDPASKRLLLEIDQPYANHNGGQVRIGPDGYLYIGMGDGGSGGDPERRALNVGMLLGKLLRIDPTPSDNAPYSIPPDNPFVGVDSALPEIYAVGLRNPWRFTFDTDTNDLWIADVGQGEWEEVDVAWADEGTGKGANFGWSAFEGTHRFNDDQPEDGVTMPIFEYKHGVDCSISGGVRYRGTALPSLVGWYIYGDYCSGQVRAFPVNDDRTAGEEFTLTTQLDSITEVAQGPDGELYVLTLGGGGTIVAVQPTS